MAVNSLKNYLHVDKPWGAFDQYTLNEPATVKIITIKSGGKTSLQSHTQRLEFWVALDGGLIFTINNQEILPKVGEWAFVPVSGKHRVAYVGEGQARFLEISFGHFDEEDITRYQDDYQRK